MFRVGYLLGEAPRPYSNITRFFMQNRALILLAALILFYILSITKFKQINNKRAFLKVYRNIFICIAIAVVFSCVYFTFINTSVELGRITSEKTIKTCDTLLSVQNQVDVTCCQRAIPFGYCGICWRIPDQ